MCRGRQPWWDRQPDRFIPSVHSEESEHTSRGRDLAVSIPTTIILDSVAVIGWLTLKVFMFQSPQHTGIHWQHVVPECASHRATGSGTCSQNFNPKQTDYHFGCSPVSWPWNLHRDSSYDLQPFDLIRGPMTYLYDFLPYKMTYDLHNCDLIRWPVTYLYNL